MHKQSLVLSTIFILGFLVAACGAATPAQESAAQPAEVQSAAESSSADEQPAADQDATVSPQTQAASGAYPIVDTNQTICYDDAAGISCPEESGTYYGQDAQYVGNEPAYQDNGDGTVTDLVTGLTWIQDPGDKVSYAEALQIAEDYEFAGYDDWRMPSIKELYSQMDFSGIDNAQGGGEPFIDTDYFVFQFGDTSAGERAIDSQWITSSIYVDAVMGNQECFFGVNFADGRIKCYPTRMNNGAGYYLRLVRGDAYGLNDFIDNSDGTITDAATNLIWQQADSAEGMDWPSALNYCEALTLGGYDDWRLPNAKELQSIVDYSRSPETTNSAAIDPVFATTQITNEAGQADYAYYWSSTTHVSFLGGGNAAYIAFGRSIGDMGNGWIDVHGAGSQRSDPKTGDPADYPYSFGPQGDSRRLLNYVRCVRSGVSNKIVTGGDAPTSTIAGEGSAAAGGQPPQQAIDACASLSAGDACSAGPITGTCEQITSELACVPEGGAPPNGQNGPPNGGQGGPPPNN